jgi:hypothetical protein
MALDNLEEALVTFTRLSPESEDEFVSVSIVKGQDLSDINLAPGTYDISIDMFLRDRIHIPEKTVEKTSTLFFPSKLTYPSMDFDKDHPFPSGGVRIRTAITEEDLKKKTLILYAISPAIQFVSEQDRYIEDVEQSAKIDEYSSVYGPLLRPVFQ